MVNLICLETDLRNGPISIRTTGSAVSTRTSRNIDLGFAVTKWCSAFLDLLRSIQSRV